MPAQFLIALYLGILGAMLGSFLNVCAHRLPRGESLVRPRSHCPACGALVRWYDNIPILSFLLLGGRCRSCKKPISLQYPLVEAAAALACVSAYLTSGLSCEFFSRTVFLLVLLGIAVTDWRSYTIPDLFSMGALAAGLAFSLWPGGLTPLQSVTGLIAGGGVLYIIAVVGEYVFRKEAMGGGDVKMLAMIGAFLGWPGVVFTLFAGSLAGSLVYGWINFVLRREKLVPFGVFLALGAGSYVFAGSWLIRWYLSFFNL